MFETVTQRLKFTDKLSPAVPLQSSVNCVNLHPFGDFMVLLFKRNKENK